MFEIQFSYPSIHPFPFTLFAICSYDESFIAIERRGLCVAFFLELNFKIQLLVLQSWKKSTMPRHDDKYSNTRLDVGHLSSMTRSRDLERVFSRYGR